jgi:trimeric autotransporter adhesin
VKLNKEFIRKLHNRFTGLIYREFLSENFHKNKMHNTIQQSQIGKNTRSVFLLRMWIGFLIYLMGGFPTLVFALPQDGEIVSGQGSIATSGNDMVVHQTSDKLIANWQSFSIGSGESVEFKQPSASSIALNNVIGLSPSVILGSLKSNGQVFLSNGSGVIFGQGAQVNVGGLLATTLGITNDDFLSGNYNFTQDASRPLSSVINRGLIEASYVGLLAPGVENTGTIVANLGSVGMASGKAASLDFVGDGLINFAITEAVDGDVLDDEGNVIDHRVKNVGLIQADGGRVVLSAKDAGNIIQNVVNNEGIIEAHSAVEKNGEIFLMGGDSGIVANSGTLDASGKESGQTGGTVHMVGEKVGVLGEGVVDVSGNAGGGTALIGGDVQGSGDVQTASNTYVGEDAAITADAIENGDGGKVVVWADDTTRIYGSVSATGGALSGDGGFVETSGQNYLQITRAVDVSAAFGLGGEWLIDPRDITIDVAGSGNVGINSSDPFVSTGDSSILGVDLIIAALTGGANVTITTGSDGAQAGDITLNADLDYNGTGANTLSLIAHNDIIFNSSILDSSAGGDTLNLVFIADSDLSGSGNLVVNIGASVDAQGGNMQVTARDVDIQGTLDAGAGDLTITIAQAGGFNNQIQVGDAAACVLCSMVITGAELQKITASNLTIENTGSDIYVDNVTAANSDNVGTMVFDANGNVEFGRDALDIDSSFFHALTVISDAKVLIGETLDTDVGDIVITADADNSGDTGDELTLQYSPDLNSAGDIVLNGSTSSSVGIFSTGQAHMTAQGTIFVNDDFDGNSLAFLDANNGIFINGDFTPTWMQLNGDLNGTADGIDQIVFAAGISISAKVSTGHITLHKAEALGSITFTSGSGIDLLGDFTANGAVSFDADTHVSVGTGLFSIASGKTLDTNGNTLTINALDIEFQGNIDVGSSSLTLTAAQPTSSSTTQIVFGNNSACPSCDFGITGADLENITAGTLTIENSGNFIWVDGITAANSENIGQVILNSGKDTLFRNNASIFSALTVNSKAGLDIRASVTTDVGDLILNADVDLTSGSGEVILFKSGPALTSAGNLILNGSVGSAGIQATGLITLHADGTLTLNDDFNATSTATVTANNGININGDYVLGGNITLDGDADLNGSGILTFADGVTLESSGGTVTLGESVALGAVALKAQGGMALNGNFTSNGVTTIDADTSVSLGGGLFTIASGATLNTNGSALSINALDIDLLGNINVGTGDAAITIAQPGVGAQGIIMLGNNNLCPSCAMQISGAELQRITAGSLTFENSGNAIYIDNILEVNSNTIGTVILTSAGDAFFTNNASTFNALTVNSQTAVDIRVALTTDTGDLILNADTDSTGGTFDRILFKSAPTLTSVNDIVLNSSVDIPGIDSNTSIVMVAGGTIHLNDDFTAGGDATLSANNGINVNGNVTVFGTVDFNGDANVSVDGNDTVTFADGVTLSSTADGVTLGKSVALGAITLNARDGLTLDGDFSSFGTTTINADTGISFGTGTFTVTGGNTLNTNGNDLFISALDFDLPGNINTGVGNASIAVVQPTVGTQNRIMLGDNASCIACTMQISGAELQNIAAGTLTIENTGEAIFIDNITAANSNNIGAVILAAADDALFLNNGSTFNALTVNSQDAIDIRTAVTTDVGDLILSADTDSTGESNHRILFKLAPTLTSAGDLVLNSSVGLPGVEASGSVFMHAGGTLSINDDFIATGGSTTITADNGINVNGNFTASADIVLNGDLNGTTDGNDTIAFADGVTVTSIAAGVTVGRSLALGSITINARDGLTITDDFTSNGLTILDADTGVTVGTGTFTVASGATLNTNGNTLLINALDIDLLGNINVGVGDATISIAQPPSGSQNKISLGDNTPCPSCDMQISGAELQNIAAGTLTIENSGDLIFVDNITAANSDNIGTLILTSDKDTLFRNNASTFNALIINSKAGLDIRTAITTDTGDLILNADTDATNGAGEVILFKTAPTLTSAGDLTLNGSVGVAGIQATGSVFMHAGGTLTLNDDFNTSGETTITADNGININGAFTAFGDIVLNGDLNGTVDGNDTVVLANGITSTSGSINLSATSTLGGITIQAANGIDVNSAFTSNGATVFHADSNFDGAGTFTVTATGLVQTGGNTLTITADDVDLAGTLNASDVTLRVSDGGPVVLGNTTGDFTIDGTELQNITANNFFLTEGFTSYNLTVDGITAANSENIGTVNLYAGYDIIFDNNDSVFNALNLEAGHDINLKVNVSTDTGSIAAVTDTGSWPSPGDFHQKAGTTLTSALDIDITAANVNLNGNLLSGGTITINGVVFTGGGILIDAADGILLTNDVFNNGEITIDADNNNDGVGDFEIIAGKIVESFGNNISITANDFIINGRINAGIGTLTLLSSVAGSTIGLGNAAGSIQISGAELQNMTAASLIVGSALNSGVAVDGVTLTDIFNIGSVSLNSGGAVDFSGSDSTFKTLSVDQSSSINVNVALSTSAGALDFTSAGDINVNVNTTSATTSSMTSGGIIQGAGAITATALTTSSASETNITTQTASLNFANSGSGDVTVNNTGALSLVGSNSAGNLSVTASGALTQSAALTVSGTTNLDAAGNDITLTDTSNDFGEPVSVNGANVTLVDINGIDLGASTVTGNLDLTAGGAVTNSSALAVTGATNVSAAGFDVSLDNAGNDFDGTVTVTGANVSLTDLNDITLGAATATGTLTVSAGDGVTIDGAVTAGGITTINTNNDDDVPGDFTVTATGSLVTNDNDLFISARDIDLQGTVNAGLGSASITISQLTVGSQGIIMLGDNTICPTCTMQISGVELQNITAAGLTIENATEAIFIDNITAANSDNIGLVTLTSAADAFFTNNASTFNALTVNSKAAVDVRAALTTDTGNLILNADTDGNGGAFDRILFKVSPTLTSAGDITLNSSVGVLGIEAVSSVTMFAGGAITLDDDFTAGVSADLSANNGININGNFVTPGSINLDGDANGIVDGNDTITFADGFTLASTGGSIALGKTVALGVININARDGVTLLDSFTSFGLTTIDADSNVSLGTGTFTVASGATLNTNGNTLNLNALDIDLLGNIDVGAGDATITIAQPVSGSQSKIVLGDNTVCPTCDMQISGAELQNITARTLTIENASELIFVDNITAANSNNVGTVILNSKKDTLFRNNASTFNALTINSRAGLDIRVGITTDTGAMLLNADTDASGGPGEIILFKSAPTLTSATDLTLNGSVGTADIQSQSSLTMHAGGTLTLNDDFTTTGAAILTADNGININGGFTATSEIELNGNLNGTVDGNDTITFANGITVESLTKSIILDSAATTSGGITVRAADGIDVNGAFISNGATVLNSDNDANGAGTFTVGALGSVLTNGNTLSITADDINLIGSLNASDITLLVSDGGTIGVANAVGDMTVDGAELQNITTANLTIGNAANGSVTVDGVTAANTANIVFFTLNSGDSVDFAGAASTFDVFAFNIDQSNSINVDTALTVNTGQMIFNSSGNINVNADVMAVTHVGLHSGASIATNAATITGASLDTSSVTGTNIKTQVGFLAVSNTGIGDVLVDNTGALNLGNATNTGGQLDVATTGSLTINGNVSADGDVTLAAQDAGGTEDVLHISGTVTSTNGNIDVSADDSVDLEHIALTANNGSVTATGTKGSVTLDRLLAGNGLTINSAGAVTQFDAFTITGATNINAAGQGVTLDNASNDFGTVSVTGANVTLADTTNIIFDTSTVTGNLDVTAEGTITDSGTVTVVGNLSATTTTHSGQINLGTLAVSGTIGLAMNGVGSANIDNGALDIEFSTITVGGNFTATNTAGGITQNGALTVAGTSTFAAGAGNDIILTNAGNDFTGSVGIVSGNNVTLVDQNSIDLDASTTSGNFMITAGGTVTQAGALSVTGMTMISAIGHDVTLNIASNDFVGEVGINANNVSITDTNSITFKASTLSGGMTANANDGVTINGAVSTGAGSSINADSDANYSGLFSVTVAGIILTNNNTLSITADDIDLQGTLNAGLSDITVLVSDNGTIGFGNTSGDMTIDGSELQNIFAANLILGSTTNGNITIDGISAANSDNVDTITINSGGNIDFVNNDSVFNALNIHAVTDINVNTNLETDTGNFVAIADFENNTIGDFNLGTGTTLTSALDIDITAENVNLNGDMVAGGTITINGEIFADDPIFLYAVDGIIITEDINNNESITIDADTNRDGIGDFELVGGVLIKSNGFDISITANDFIINGIIDAGTGNVNLFSSVGGSIGIGEASGDIEIDNSELQNITAGNLNIGDALNGHIRVKNVQVVDVANISEMTLNATQAGKSVYFYGPASSLNDLTVNAANDVRVYGGLTAKDTIFNAGDDVKLWGGNYSFDSLTAVAADDVIIYGTLNTVNADYTAGDDIWLDGYQTYTGNLNATAGDDITIDWELTAATATLNAGDDVRIHGTTHFGDLTVNAGDDISVKGSHVTTGTANLTAVDNIFMRDTLSVNTLNANAGNDIHLHGNGTGFSFNLTAGDDVHVHGNYSTNSFTATAGDDVHLHGTNSMGVLTLNAADDIHVKGNTGATVANLNAGDDISLRDTISADLLSAIAGDSISVYGIVNANSANYTATLGDVRLDGYQTYGILNATVGDDISIGWELNATMATLTAGDDVSIKGTTRFGDLTVNATDDIRIRGDQQTSGTATLIAGDNISLRDNNSFGALDASAGTSIHSHGLLSVTNDGNLSAGDDIHLHGNNSFGGELNGSAGDDIHAHGLLTVTGDGNLDAGDDIHLHGNNSFGGDLNVDAGDDIHSHGLLTVGNDGSLVAGDDIHLHGTSSFGGSLFASANGDIRSHGGLTVTGSSFMSAGNDIYMDGQFNSGAWTAIAGDDIRLRGDYNISTADLKANDEIRIDRSTINSGNFSAEADFDNNGSGAVKLEKHSSITSTGDIDLSGYGLKIKGSLSAAGTITLTDKSE